MIKVEYIQTWGFQHAIRGMRNPMNSWARSDSDFYNAFPSEIGKSDLDLMQKLFKAGTEHRKYLRQIFVSMDITAPLYWWKEFDTYKIGTVENSCSTMHKLTAKPFDIDDFSHEHLDIRMRKLLEENIKALNDYRNWYVTYDPDELEMKGVPSKELIWWQMIQMLPTSYNQKRTVTMNYENVFKIIHQRGNHKLSEWREFVKTLKRLPHVKEIGGLK